jgi:MFS transporter, UMF1 family
MKEPAHTVERVAPLALARGAIQGIFNTARRARSYPEPVRFLVGRALYAEAASTIGIFMAIYPIVQVGFNSGQKDRLLLVAILAAVGEGFFWGVVVDRIGPRDSLMRVLVVWSVALALIAATGFTILPSDTLWLIAPLAGFALGGTWATDRPLMIGLSPPQYLG